MHELVRTRWAEAFRDCVGWVEEDGTTRKPIPSSLNAGVIMLAGSLDDRRRSLEGAGGVLPVIAQEFQVWREEFAKRERAEGRDPDRGIPASKKSKKAPSGAAAASAAAKKQKSHDESGGSSSTTATLGPGSMFRRMFG